MVVVASCGMAGWLIGIGAGAYLFAVLVLGIRPRHLRAAA
ncbi:hypothetical protein JCM19237_1639 [Photobacterium aphoticum]|uniref:Uncharacterized protein n=1 Tax=Photobacterium aphoticum TaxID=754436 RepID=A0A090QVZ2_9GAMM|nr:hypothetical protein JCM19237_1639 [Photobacterium aphoticum]